MSCNETILLVDDEPMLLRVGERMLTRLGYRVIKALGGEAAVETFRVYPDVDVVILDMLMPGMGGAETCRKLREINPDIAIILASGNSEESQAQNVAELGCQAFIQKPFSLQSLSVGIREVLDHVAETRASKREDGPTGG